MQVRYTKRFAKMLERLPAGSRAPFFAQEEIFKTHWRDPRLHTKRLHGVAVVFSFRITRNYRVLFTFADRDTALFSAIGNRKDIYR